MSESNALLLKLTKAPQAVPTELQAAAEALLAAGLAERKPAARGREERLVLTAAGLARKQEILDEEKRRKAAEKEAERQRKAAEKEAERQRKAAERPARAPASTRAPGPEVLLALEQRLLQGIKALLDQHLQEIRALLHGAAAPVREATHDVPPTPDPEVAQRILAALQRLDAQRRYDGIIPLRALRPQLPGVARGVFDATLADLERNGQIGLKIANDPLAVPEPEAGIRVEGRGLIYYVVRH